MAAIIYLALICDKLLLAHMGCRSEQPDATAAAAAPVVQLGLSFLQDLPAAAAPAGAAAAGGTRDQGCQVVLTILI